MVLLGRFVAYALSCLLFCCLIEIGRLQTVRINYPHFPIRSYGYYNTWNVTAGMSDTFVFPPENVTTFDSYSFFVNEINFNDSPVGNIFIGAKNVLYELNLNLTEVRKFSWPASPDRVSVCEGISFDDSFACHNHIRTYRKLPDAIASNRLFVCGTDAYVPKCRTLDLTDISNTTQASSPKLNGDIGVISVHPSVPFLWDYQGDHQIVASGFYEANMWNDYDFARYNISYNTTSKNLVVSSHDRTLQSSDDFQIREPYFPVNLYNIQLDDTINYGMYLFFFREREFKAQDASAAPVRSRVLRICKNDSAISNVFFGSLVKAEIFCAKRSLGTAESYGAQTFYYTGLRDTHMTTVDSRWYGNRNVWHKLLYGVFTSEQYAPNGTAVCVYFAGIENLAVVSEFLDEAYRGIFEVFNQNHFLKRTGDKQADNFLNCEAANRRGKTDYILTESGIQQYKGLYLPLVEFPGEVFTKIAIDRACVVMHNDTSKCLVQDVMFLCSYTGRIYKVTMASKASEYPAERRLGLDGLSHDPVVSQEWELADTRSVEQLYLRTENNKKYIYATTYSRVYKFSAVNCHLYANCRDCIRSRDPHCVWDTSINGGKCVFNTLTDSGSSGEGTVPSNIYQNIHNGSLEICSSTSVPYCDNLRVIPHSPNGFRVTGANTCHYTNSMSINVTSHSCNEPDVPAATYTYALTASASQDITDDKFLGRHLYKVVFAAVGSLNTSQYTFFVTTVNGGPTVPISSEVTASSNATDSINVIVSLRGCSLHSEPINHQICVRFKRMSGVATMTQCQTYSGINVFRLTGLFSCESTMYNVSVSNSFGTSGSYSSSVMPLQSGPNPVTGLTTVNGLFDITLNWSPPSSGGNNYCNVIGYSVFVNSEQRVDCVPVMSSYTINGLTSYTSYQLGVRACSNGGLADTVTATVSTACRPPSRIRDTNSQSLDSNTLRFTWTEPAIINGTLQYMIIQECFNQSTVTVDEEPPVTISETSFTISSLQPTTLCCIRVFPRATCNGNSLIGDERQICETTHDGSPGPVEGLTAKPSSPQSVFVRWYPPLNYTVPGINYRISVLQSEETVFTETTFNLYFHVIDLQNDTEYTVTVSAITKDGIAEGPLETVNVMTLPSFPDPPTDVTLSFNGCTLTVSWEDPTSDRYSIDSYTAVIRCNRFTDNRTVSATGNSAQFNICPDNMTEPSLSWCAAQVFSENDVGPSDFSQWASGVVPLVKPSTPQCFITEDRGNSITFSFTFTTAYALDGLQAEYILKDENMEVLNASAVPVATSNTLTFYNLIRSRDYEVRLRLCDRSSSSSQSGDDACSSYCVKNFTSNSPIPPPPVNVTLQAIIFFRPFLTWDAPPNENASIFTYYVQIRGPDYSRVIHTNERLIHWPEALTAESSYSMVVLAYDTISNVNSSYGKGVSFTMPSGIPGAINFINARYYKEEDRLIVFWERPAILNGTVRNYTLIWWNTVGGTEDCDRIYRGTDNGAVMSDVKDTDTLTHDFRRAEGLDGNTRGFLLCISAVTDGGRGDWNYTNIGPDGIIEAVTGNNPETGSNTALYIVIVLALMAMLAAVVISVIFALLCYFNYKHKEPSSHSQTNGDVPSKWARFKRNRSSKVTIPLEPSQSLRSNAPIIPPE